MNTKGKIIGVAGNMVTVKVDEGSVSMNEIGYIKVANESLKAEVIRIKPTSLQMQVFEMTKGIKVDDEVEFTQELLAVELGPGLLGQIYDGLQNPLPQLAEKAGYFLEKGIYEDALSKDKSWHFKATANVDDKVIAGDSIGFVKEGLFNHQIMVPFSFLGNYKIKSIVSNGDYKITDNIAILINEDGDEKKIGLSFTWPVKKSITNYKERLLPKDPMVTKVRLIDTFFPVAKGGTYCIPGPFGAGKTVLQHVTSKNADVDIVIVAACGERAGEVVETLKEFPEIIDERTGKSLMERTIIICNTSSMPVASREASVYTAITLAEYYRQMGLHVLLLADSTSRWAQAMREMSGRLEEIPGEEAFPAYLESTIAGFYERAGIVKLNNGKVGSITIGGTVSPAGGNFEEPVTQATLKVVGAFHGLSRERSDARKYPAIHPTESWSKYKSLIEQEKINFVYSIVKRGFEVEAMMKVVGQEGTSINDYLIFLKCEFVDSVYIQQDSFHPIDSTASIERQKFTFDFIYKIVNSNFNFDNKEDSRKWFNNLRQKFIDLNYSEYKSDSFNRLISEITNTITEKIDNPKNQLIGEGDESYL